MRKKLVLRKKWMDILIFLFVLFALFLFMELFFRSSYGISITGYHSAILQNKREIISSQNLYIKIEESYNFGFRSKHYNTTKQDDVYRIISLGDSYTFGDQINNIDDTWPYQLEFRLNKEYNFPIEIINLGLNGANTVDELSLLKKYGLSHEPDLIILQFTHNDVLPQNKGGSYLYDNTKLSDYIDSNLFSFIIKNSYFISFIDEAMIPNNYKKEFPNGWFDLYDENFKGYKDMRTALNEIKLLAKSNDVDFLFVIYNFKNSKLEKYVSSNMFNLSEELNIDVIDMLPHFINLNSKNIMTIDGHPNENANNLASEVIASHIIQQNYSKLTN
jgi:hypothetical protein